jgi:hypothetical protein
LCFRIVLPLLAFICGWCKNTEMPRLPARSQTSENAQDVPFANFCAKSRDVADLAQHSCAARVGFPWALGKAFDPLAPAPTGIIEWYFKVLSEMLSSSALLAWSSGRDCRDFAFHHRHCAVGSDSVLRLDERIETRPRGALLRHCGSGPAAGYHRYRLLDYSVEARIKMNYPFWDIPHIGSGWVIGMIAIFHVMISQFAVGGGCTADGSARRSR